MKKLIILYGFAASGKSTLAKKFINENPLDIAIEGDQIIGMIGQWRNNEEEARKLVFGHTKSIISNHLQAGYNVVVPYLLNDVADAESIERIAKENDATFIEIYINLEKEDAVNRLIERGCWGEEGSRKLTEKDRDELENRFDCMVKVMSERENVIEIKSKKDDIDGTFNALLDVLKQY